MTKDPKPTLPKGVTSEVSDNKEKATTTISVSAPYELLNDRYTAAFNELQKHLKADGFRPGKVPADVAKKQIPEIMVLDQAGRNLIGELYLPLLQIHEVDGIGEPRIQVNKLAKDNPFEFSITIAKFPEIDLADYEQIRDQADKTPIDPEVDDKELNDAIEALRLEWARQDKYQTMMKADPESTKTTDPRQIDVSDDELPELNDEFIKKLGDYESVDDFKTKFRANIKANKAMQELDRRRAELLGKIIEQARFTVPELVYQAEVDRLVEVRKSEIKQAGLKYHDYLKAINKSEDEMRQVMLAEAKNRVHSQMVIAEIAKNQNLKPDNDLVKKEVEYLQKLYPDAPADNLHAYVQSQLTTNEVLKWLVKPTDDLQPTTNNNKDKKQKDSKSDKK